jgi:inosose dehydratase
MDADRVLREMRDLGLTATELGPEGFLPAPPEATAAKLAEHGLAAVGGFVPLVLHDPARDPLAALAPALAALVAAGAGTVVVAADAGAEGYDAPVALEEEGWSTLLANLERVAAAAAERGLTAALHPHVGTLVEREEDVARVLEGSSVPLCLDTGHLLIGGTDPAALAARVPGRVGHCHLKDVDRGLAEEVRAGRLAYSDAVRRGLYRPLGAGDVPVGEIVERLEGAGYAGWYVMEQDTRLAGEPAAGAGGMTDVWASLAFLEELAR